MQQAATSNLHAPLILSLVDAHRDVGLRLTLKALLNLATTHDVALLADEGAGRGLEDDRHRRLFNVDGIQNHRVRHAGVHVADVGVVNADHRNDVARVCLLGLEATQ